MQKNHAFKNKLSFIDFLGLLNEIFMIIPFICINYSVTIDLSINLQYKKWNSIFNKLLLMLENNFYIYL